MACNWKVYVDNYLEGYHIPLVHPALHKELDDEQYRVEPRRYYSIQHAPLRGAAATDADRLYRPDAADDAAQYYWLFPNMMLNIYFGQLQTNVVLPRGRGSHDRRLRVVRARPERGSRQSDDWARRVAFSDKVQDEDRGHLRGRAAEPAVTRLRPRAVRATTGTGRPPLPRAAARVPELIAPDRR